jgi:glucose-1-phosphate thymidylyltransferase
MVTSTAADPSRVTWGIVPCAGLGTRMQPLAFSKELLPVGTLVEDGRERTRAVAEYVLERMVRGGATRLCLVVSPGKLDILGYFGESFEGVPLTYVVQRQPGGLVDALERAMPLVREADQALVGLPDTVWFPEHAYRALPDDDVSLLLFPVDEPDLFDAVLTDRAGNVLEVRVKQRHPGTKWIWGAIKLGGRAMHRLFSLWHERGRSEEYVGTLLNAYLREGGTVRSVKAGKTYVDVGTLAGYRRAVRLLNRPQEPRPSTPDHSFDV